MAEKQRKVSIADGRGRKKPLLLGSRSQTPSRRRRTSCGSAKSGLSFYVNDSVSEFLAIHSTETIRVDKNESIEQRGGVSRFAFRTERVGNVSISNIVGYSVINRCQYIVKRPDLNLNRQNAFVIAETRSRREPLGVGPQLIKIPTTIRIVNTTRAVLLLFLLLL